MSLKIPLLFKCCLLVLVAALLSWGCSSQEVVGPATTTAEEHSNETVSKLTVTTHWDNAQPSTEIAFSLPKAGDVFLEITNATGYHVRTLVDEYLEAGSHSISWDGKNDDGEDIGAGIYLYHLATSDYESWVASAFGIPFDGPGSES